MAAIVSKDEDRTSAAIGSFIFHALLIGLMLIPFMQDAVEPEQPVIVVDWGGGGQDAALGAPDQGQNDAPASAGAPPEPIAEAQPEPVTPPKASTPPPKPTKPKAKVEVPKKTPTTNNPDAASVRKAREEAKKKREQEAKEKAQADAKRRAELEKQRKIDEAAQKERDRLAAIEAEKKRKQDEYNKKKSQHSGAFGGSGSGSGSGTGGNAGNQGTSTGTGSNPFGKNNGTGNGAGNGGSGTGSGSSVGGGLSSRKVTGRPTIRDNTQETGTVVITTCVDASGKVISADYSLKGSTTQNGQLVAIAKKAARSYKFEKSSAAKQCGTISFVFKLK